MLKWRQWKYLIKLDELLLHFIITRLKNEITCPKNTVDICNS